MWRRAGLAFAAVALFIGAEGCADKKTEKKTTTGEQKVTKPAEVEQKKTGDKKEEPWNEDKFEKPARPLGSNYP